MKKSGDMTNQARTGLIVGLSWNMASLAFLAIAGIALNIVIGRLYGPEVLGTFNIAFAIFIFLSQIAAFGLQFSVLHAASTVKAGDGTALRSTIYSGFLVCGMMALLVTCLALAATPLLQRLFPAVPELGKAWFLVAPGLLPFALNKYLLNALNGLLHMRAFSLFQAGRYVLILAALAAMAWLQAPGYALAAALSISECLLLAMLLPYIIKTIPVQGSWSALIDQARKHLVFGAKVFPAGMVGELNTRVDVLMLGALMNDRIAGVYTIAALIYEAALQAVVVIRNNINPRLASDIAEGAHQRILDFSRKLAIIVTCLFSAGAVVAYFGFPLVAGIFFPGKDFLSAREPLLWLMLALPFVAAPLCYSLVLSQANHPGWQSMAMVITLIVNITANWILIPWLGMQGAAIAMGLSALTMGVSTILLARRILGIRLFF